MKQNISYLRRWLSVGNEILIVSKPELKCIKRICDEFGKYKDKIVFRFTIGSSDNEVLKFWEPGATDFEERLASLKYAFDMGFETSVSCEPFLDGNIVELFHKLKPYVKDTIWIGRMNKVRTRVDMTGWGDFELGFLAKVEDNQTDVRIWEIYEALKDEEKVRWKDSVKGIVGIEEDIRVG